MNATGLQGVERDGSDTELFWIRWELEPQMIERELVPWGKFA